MAPWQWIFLDVGNILLDEDPLTYLVFRRHLEAIRIVNPRMGFGQFVAEYEEASLRGSRWPLYDATERHLGESSLVSTWTAVDREVRADYGRHSPPIPGADDLLRRLAPLARLGLIANQPVEARAWMDEIGWRDRFEVVALSEEEGMSKPDPALFLRALERAQAEPADCLMVGDRLDNDIRPAHALGMATAWVRWPRRAAKGWAPAEPEPAAYLACLERVVAARAAHESGAEPTLVADDLDGLVRGILARIDSAKSGGGGRLASV